MICVLLLLKQLFWQPSECSTSFSIFTYTDRIFPRLPKVYYNQGKEIELSDQPSDMISLDTHDIPIFVTVTRVGNNYLLDPTQEEEAASVSSVTISFNDQSEILHTKKIGSGSLHSDPIKDLLHVSLFVSSSRSNYY